MRKIVVFICVSAAIATVELYWLNTKSAQQLLVSEETQVANATSSATLVVPPVSAPTATRSTENAAHVGAEPRSRSSEAPPPATINGPESYNEIDASVMSDLRGVAWITAGDDSPASPKFDETLIDKAKRTSTNGLANYKPVRGGVYSGMWSTVASAQRQDIPFFIALKMSRGGSEQQLEALWIKWPSASPEERVIEFHLFEPPFAQDETFKEAIHLSSAALPQSLGRRADCKEIILLPWVLISTEMKFLEKLSARAYCRVDTGTLVPLAQVGMSFLE